ncbi:hypothetical protein N9D66_01265, partial [Candidatus Nanopelagicales bacterium]|nr:hypothetical protein [Candidatus Nanopelagicales bacterium]
MRYIDDVADQANRIVAKSGGNPLSISQVLLPDVDHCAHILQSTLFAGVVADGVSAASRADL